MDNYKIVVIGSNGVGKSSLCTQFVHAKFSEAYLPASDIILEKNFVLDDRAINLTIHDTPNQKSNVTISDNSWADGDGFLVLFSIDSKSSFKRTALFVEQIERVLNTKEFPLILVGTKGDLEYRQVSVEEGKALAQNLNCRYVETSARLRHNVEDVFYGIARLVKEKRKKEGLYRSKGKGASTRSLGGNSSIDISLTTDKESKTSISESPATTKSIPTKDNAKRKNKCIVQ